MTIAPHPSAIRGPATAVRDRSIDLVRAGSLVLVVLLHATMVGVTISSDGVPVFVNALETDWFAPVSWLVQMMPLFFIAGGVTAIGSWRRAAVRGEAASRFVSRRVARLMRPAIAVFLAVAAGLGVLSFAGVPAEIVAEAGFRISQPLWFLGVFLLVQSLVPVMAAAHERRPMLVLAALLSGVAVVDAVRFATGADAVGFLNLALVWLFVQQLGFWHADGRLDGTTVRSRVTMLGAVAASLVALVALGPYSADMYVNLNPPTLVLAVFGAGQLLLLSLATPWLRRAARRPVVAALADTVGARAMTVYLWHMPVLIGLAGLSVLGALSGAIALPELHTAGWWVTRPVWLAAGAIAVGIVAAAAARFERGRSVAPTTTRRAAAGATVGVGAVAVMFALGLSAGTALACAGLACLAAALAGDFPRLRRRAAALARPATTRKAGTMTADRGVHA